MDNSETVGVPETLFNAFRHGNTRPNTPILWTVACDESFSKNWYLQDSTRKYFTADEIKAIEADIANNKDIDPRMKIPSPYFNTYLDRWFKPELAEAMKVEYDCPEGSVNCHKEVNKFFMAKSHVSKIFYVILS